ncbi:MAG: hypothetical protein V4726_19280 [Verrucomicrobiota bacterium]
MFSPTPAAFADSERVLIDSVCFGDSSKQNQAPGAAALSPAAPKSSLYASPGDIRLMSLRLRRPPWLLGIPNSSFQSKVTPAGRAGESHSSARGRQRIQIIRVKIKATGDFSGVFAGDAAQAPKLAFKRPL